MPLTERGLKQIGAAEEYIFGNTLILGFFPFCYGIAVFIASDKLWGSGLSGAYTTALLVPKAPESWGAIALINGAVIMICACRRFRRGRKAKMLLALAAFSQSAWCFFFMLTFIKDIYDVETYAGVPAVIGYFTFTVLYINRARLAWGWRNEPI